ncbi:endolytic transglycosylase MltG [Streptomyces sp. NBC_00237]|uniref:endolytic transglycosylase MltG n=1 Tax=Streptomyces sp. NBC_00237 TaxID=2975687 RepID=UPI002252521F|nr:endolytic transglycosylase MltG [Streptomyces sp. NBC_00237]MCX5207035.1 endolytic transglycosylase MltG [Streptomyces sp. NBC_00237]
MEFESPHVSPPPPRRRPRRGRLILLVCTLAALGAVTVGVVLFLVWTKDGPGRATSLTIPEGWRSSQVYAAVDKAVGAAPGTAKKAAASTDLGLPAAAQGNPEGYLFPATYPVKDGTTASSLLTYMVKTAGERLGAGPEVRRDVVIASIVQAEADTADDMGKVARVIQNRLARDMPLQMDSTLNYAMNRSTLDTTHEDTRIDSPYNTYERKGLPPTPIGNPGLEAVRATRTPPPGNWLYFVTVKPGDTRFTDDYEVQKRNVAEFNKNRRGR